MPNEAEARTADCSCQEFTSIPNIDIYFINEERKESMPYALEMIGFKTFNS
jgi:hypothetical protein